MPPFSTDRRTRAANPLRETSATATPITRRRVLGVASWSLATLAAAILAGCDKPYYDRNRGMIVVRRHDK